MKRYNIINNSLGWLCFLIAAVTYMLTLEPTASFWDCPEFISQGFKLEVGHPPGNPIFMLAARFFVNFAGGDVTHVAYAVNTMSAMFSAGTILLLFWTITHLTRKITVKDNATEMSAAQMIAIFGAGLCGALMYTWSDTFWFSAVEGEVYAFSSFCTALVFWLILKWENRAEQPHSDRYFILIAYVIGISIAVHLLNLLCIPAIVLVVYYKRCEIQSRQPGYKGDGATLKGSLTALLLSFVIVALILFGLVPGFVEIAQYFELLFVNTFHCSYNTGVLVYVLLLMGVFAWGAYELHSQKSAWRIKLSFFLGVMLSGMPFIGNNLMVPLVLGIALAVALLVVKPIKVRMLNIAFLSTMVIFIGYSSYALLLIRSSANPPMNQNAPDNVFALSSYLSREQYGETPLLYGRTPYSSTLIEVDEYGNAAFVTDTVKAIYSKVAKTDPSQPDQYVAASHAVDQTLTPELNMLFPRIYHPSHVESYKGWLGISGQLGDDREVTIVRDTEGNTVRTDIRPKPTMLQNLQYFFNYQLSHMYWRYFMWNFAGRQNDIQGNGEPNHGNWITGIGFLDSLRLGDQSLLPYDEGEGNRGHNVFFALPLLLGILGILWQAFSSKRGIEQFWVIFFLFFMTGIAIVLYLNQTPGQPRERDYAFAGSFYAFAIWVGLAVPAISWALGHVLKKPVASASVAAVIGLLVPVQVVSQTWDDHDRSGRYAARDFGMNYLNSLDDNAVIFTNGDNDTFPLWYAQEVEGVRTDVKVVNLSYLSTDWYANQIKHPTYEAKELATIATPLDYAYDALQYSFIDVNNPNVMNLSDALKGLYASPVHPDYGVHTFPATRLALPVDLDRAVKAGRITPDERAQASDTMLIDLNRDRYLAGQMATGQAGVTLYNVLALDLLASSVANGWDRPIYFASTVPDEYYVGLSPYLRTTGMAYEVSPIYRDGGYNVNTDKAYRNITERFRWGGLDAKDADIYLDETVRRMVSSTRSQILETANALFVEGLDATQKADSLQSDPSRAKELKAYAADRFNKCGNLLSLMESKLPARLSPYMPLRVLDIVQLYGDLATTTGNKTYRTRAHDIALAEISKYTRNILYYQSMSRKSPGLYGILPALDKYIDGPLYLQLVQTFLEQGGSEGELDKIEGFKEIDMNRLYTRASAYLNAN